MVDIYRDTSANNSQIVALLSDNMVLASHLFFLRMPPGGEYHLLLYGTNGRSAVIGRLPVHNFQVRTGKFHTRALIG